MHPQIFTFILSYDIMKVNIYIYKGVYHKMKKKYSALALSFIIAISSIASSVINSNTDYNQQTEAFSVANPIDPEREDVD